MAQNRAWSQELSLRVEIGRQQAAALLALVDERLPGGVQSLGEHEDWEMIGRSLLARSAGLLESVFALVPARREADAAGLLRVMFEHITTFAWIAAAPAKRMPLFVKKDRQSRLKIDADFARTGQPLLPSDVRRQFETEVRDVEGAMPEMPERCEGVDGHWGRIIPQLEADHRDRRSFRGLYRLIYREASQYIHPTVLGLQGVIEDAQLINGAPTVIVHRLEEAPDLFNAFTIAPAAFGMGLFIASRALPEWPDDATVDGIFDPYPSPDS